MKEQIISERQYKIRTITSFVVFFLFISLSLFAWKKLRKEQKDSGVQKTLRAGFITNEKVFGYFFNSNKLLKTYPRSSAIKNVRVNGNLGMSSAFDAANWQLQVIKKEGDTLLITLDEVRKLPKTEIVYDFKCIEGWSQRTWWGGVKFSDFIRGFHLENEAKLQYVGLKTPDEKYYVGIDMPGALHAQTILAYEMNGKPLPLKNGYPLRLIIPLKYGIKSIKRIGTIYFSNERPPDYWAERGYDYYSGH
jgi:DMSO/TMAO reductase YedYZ molybdopterin-dependent catalytic subunit